MTVSSLRQVAWRALISACPTSCGEPCYCSREVKMRVKRQKMTTKLRNAVAPKVSPSQCRVALAVRSADCHVVLPRCSALLTRC